MNVKVKTTPRNGTRTFLAVGFHILQLGPFYFLNLYHVLLFSLKKGGGGHHSASPKRRDALAASVTTISFYEGRPPPLPGRCCCLENHGSVTNDINFIKRHYICMCAKWRQLGSGWLVVKLQCYSRGRLPFIITQFDQVIKHENIKTKTRRRKHKWGFQTRIHRLVSCRFYEDNQTVKTAAHLGQLRWLHTRYPIQNHCPFLREVVWCLWRSVKGTSPVIS
jgi:hypothetical protein